MRIRWLATALRNLDEEAEFVARENPAAAKALIRRIHTAVHHLEANPALGRPGRIQGTRELVVPDTAYIIPYRIRPRLGQVEILRVFHASRRLPERW